MARETQKSTLPIASKKAAIVIPYHRANMNPDERLALLQCCKILRNYNRYMVLPDGLNVAEFLQSDPELQFEFFDPAYFKSAVGYNLLCRRSEFYDRFLAYEYMLLYQMDAYVFEDALEDWCNRGYDYIGGPWPNYEFQLTSQKRWTQFPLLRPFLRKVGNGGFSLRRNRAFRDASNRLQFWINHTQGIPEDVFWCNVANYLSWKKLKIAPFDEAVRFAFDASPEKCFALTNGVLPFGCHGWNTVYRDFWARFIGECSFKN